MPISLHLADHAVASNWRVLTRRTLSKIDSSREDLPLQIVNGMIEQLATLLFSCGVGDFTDNAQNVHKHAADKLLSLFTAARKLSKMIGESVVSEDLVASIVGGGYEFDGEHMEDAYPQGRAKLGQRVVICTTELGLFERKREKVLLKAKVFSRSV